ncbi:MAG TPA: competence/damage-inducible protein A [Halanaerobiales bacterium]|nr:competence/damage-inducible protein A [Halanaerobiales bacterium]
MITEIISIGTELILGDVVDTNSSYIAQKMTENGFDIHYLNTVGDNKQRLVEVFKRAMMRSELVITTGGLGPTDDDLTREAIASATGTELLMMPELLTRVKEFFKSRKYKLTENNKKQGLLPEGARALSNEIGTAPGIMMERDDCVIIALPGVPREMKHIFNNSIIPYLKEINSMIIRSKVLNFFGIGESNLETELRDIIRKQSNPTLALLAGNGDVKIRITAKGKRSKEVDRLIEEAEVKIRNRVGRYIYGVNEQGLEEATAKLLQDKGLNLSLAESCTGGLLGNRITNVPGSSVYFKGGIVAYSNGIKINVLGVKKDTILKRGAVSKETAKEMAICIRKKMETDIGIGITGIAGPGGGSKDKPVGLIYVGLSTRARTKVYKLNLPYDRAWNKWLTAQYALYYLYRYLSLK